MRLEIEFLFVKELRHVMGHSLTTLRRRGATGNVERYTDILPYNSRG